MMKVEWHEIEPGTYEARVGDWLLRAGPSRADASAWAARVAIIIGDPRSGASLFLCNAAPMGSLDEAQRAAVAFAVKKSEPFVGTARAEAALAEREAIAQWFDDRAASYERRSTLVRDNPASFGGDSVAQEVAENLADAGAQARLDARTIRARTTTATLSTDTPAAITQDRGLCVVEPEYLAARPKCAVCEKLATCVGSYACDRCCMHGNEDGTCVPCGSDDVPKLLDSLRKRVVDGAEELGDTCDELFLPR